MWKIAEGFRGTFWADCEPFDCPNPLSQSLFLLSYKLTVLRAMQNVSMTKFYVFAFDISPMIVRPSRPRKVKG